MIPAELMNTQQWVCWRRTIVDGKIKKPPISAKTGKECVITDSNSWTSYEAVYAFLRKNPDKVDGIGFAFSGYGVFGIDIDNCMENGELTILAREIIGYWWSYAEISPSGTGIHIICRGNYSKGHRKGKIEIYGDGRYFTVTGNHIKDGSPFKINDRGERIPLFLSRYIKDEKPVVPAPAPKVKPTLTPFAENVVMKASRAKNGKNFLQLYNGDTTGFHSPSEADLALMGILCFWSGGNIEIVKTIFYQSALYRADKGSKYINTTAEKAMRNQESKGFFQWR